MAGCRRAPGNYGGEYLRDGFRDDNFLENVFATPEDTRLDPRALEARS